MTRTILVTGARGKTGQEVVRQLSAHRDVEIVAGSSRPELLTPEGSVRPVAFDWNAPGTWEAATAGVEAIYLMRPDLPNAAELTRALVGLRPGTHIVLLSEQSAELDSPDGWVQGVENAVTSHGATWTILRPSWFNQDLTDARHFLVSIQRHGTLAMPSGGARIAWVDARDVAAVAVAALLDSDTHRGRRYSISGPESVTLHHVAELISAASDTTVSAVDQPLADALAGLDTWLARVLESLYSRVQRGGFAEVTDAVEAITGNRARSLDTFVRENHAAWLPGVVQGGR